MFNIPEIKQQFTQVIKHTQPIENPKVDKLFDLWLEAKRDIIEAFGGELIYCYPEKITFEIDANSKEERINDFLLSVEGTWQNQQLADFVEVMRDGFYNNHTLEDFIAPNGTTIPKGAKLVKAFKHFETDKKALTDIQNMASRFIQEDKIEGYLHMSVHPLDFLSASENAYNWSTCHDLNNDYRSGNLSYMTDKSTIICYLADKKHMPITNFPFEWNSKKWRMLLFLSDDWNMMFAGRQYPFKAASALTIIKDLMMSKSGLTQGSTWLDWEDKTVQTVVSSSTGRHYPLVQEYFPVGSKLITGRELIKHPEHILYFNDLLHSSMYKPYYSFRMRNNNQYFYSPFGYSNDNTRFHIGGPVPCLQCEEHNLELSNNMRCIECEEKHGLLDDDDFAFCECCGRHIYIENAVLLDGHDGVFCPSCVDSQMSECECCGKAVYNSDLVYDYRIEQYICKECIDLEED